MVKRDMSAQGGKKIILVIEDDSILQKDIKSALEQAGFQVEQLFKGEDIKKEIIQRHPDLILLDLMLPGIDGFHILRDIKKDESLKKIPVIVLSVIDTESSISECKLYGADDYLVKSDYSLEEIVKKINKFLR